jgi:phytoene dehydrogenase-like protein
VVEDGRATGVTLEDGRVIHAADGVISNADARLMFTQMLGREEIPKHVQEDYSRWSDTGPSLSYYIVNCGLDIDLRERYGMEHDLTIYFPSYDVLRVYKDINNGILPEDFWLWAVFPSVNDSSLAPKGCSTAIFSILVPYSIENETEADPDYFDGFRAVSSKGEEYYAKKEEITRRIIARADEVYPGISDHIVFRETWTPQTLQDFTLNHKGSTMGFKVGTLAGKDKRYISKLGMDIQSGIPGLYMAGGWTEFGFATTAVIQSGRFAAFSVLGKELPAPAVSDREERVRHLETSIREFS